MTVIAMTREMGTLGKDVAARVAEKLSLTVIHHELVENRVAERMDISESAVHRFLEGEPSLWERWQINEQRLSHYSAEELLTIAERGNVLIRGWGAAQLMRDIPHVVCVRVCAPMEDRVAEMQERLALKDDPSAARREIEKNDEAHDRAIRALFNRDWRDPADYAMVLNTGRVSVERASEFLIDLIRSPEFERTDASNALLSDKLTLARVRSALSDKAGPGVGSGLDLSIDTGIVTVSGVTMQNTDVIEMVRVIGEVEGVHDVRDNVHVMPYTVGP